MGEIVIFTPRNSAEHKEQAMVDRSKTSDDSRQATDARKNSAEARRLEEHREIDAAIRAVRSFSKAEDKKAAARNLTTLLDEAKHHGVSRAMIADTIWPNDEESPSKRFYKLTLSEGAGERKGRIDHLQARPKNYKAVAEQLGICVPGWSREEALVRAFRNTAVDRELHRLVTGRASRAADPASCWHNLSEMLDALAQAIGRRCDLPAHFERIAKTSGRYDICTQKITPSFADVDVANFLLSDGPQLNNKIAVWEHHPPIPSVCIFDELIPQFQPLLKSLRLVECTSQEVLEMEVFAEVRREIRLAIGPAESIKPAALFELRTCVHLKEQESNREISVIGRWIEPDSSSNVVVRIGDRNYETIINLTDDSSEVHDWPIDDRFYQPEHYYSAWRSATADVCEILLNRRRLFPPIDGLQINESFEKSRDPTQTPEGSLGGLLERYLRSNGESSLANALVEDAQRLIDLTKAEAERQIRIAVSLNDEAIDNWKQFR